MIRGIVAIFAAVVAVTGCGDPAPPPPPQPIDLASYLTSVATQPAERRASEIAGWKLDEAAWRRLVVDPYRDVHADYARAFDAAVPVLAARLAGTITTRAHYAGDDRLAAGEARARWALPVAFKSEVASADGAQLDAVFVRDGERWRAIVGLDVVIRARVAALDADCAALLDIPAPPARCREVAWQLADAALRGNRERFTHSCSLAATACGARGKRSP